MLAARLHGNRDIRVEEIDAPSELGPHDARVAPIWCGICGSDLHEWAQGPIYIGDEALPQILGHEFSAIVLEVGFEVTNITAGERCAVLPHVFCGQCYYCQRGRQGLCRELRITGFGWPWGGLAGEAVVPSYQCIPLPDEVTFEQGAILEPLGTVMYATERVALRAGDTVLVTGGGPVGQLAVLAAAAAGAAEIYVSEPNPTRLARAEALGVTAAFDPRATDVAAEIAERTGGLGVDITFECAGSQAALDTAVDSTRAAGAVAQIALHVGPRTVVPERWTWKDLTVAGTWSFRFYDAPRILKQIAFGRIPVERIVTSHIPLADVVPRGIEALENTAAQEIKILVEVTGAA